MRHLILIPQRNQTDDYTADWEAIAAMVRAADPGVAVTLHWGPESALARPPGPRKPTLIVALRQLRAKLSVPGRLLASNPLSKEKQLERYARQWIPAPRSAPFSWGMTLDPAQWGPLIVIKTLDPKLTSHGGVVWLPTAMLPRLRPENFPPNALLRIAPAMVQSFINSGRYPMHYRVLVFLGVPLYAMSITLNAARPPMTAALADMLAAQIATNGGPRQRVLIDDKDILAFARQVSFAMPEIPLQGIDIIREHGTGRLYALESNPGGNTWHFSSTIGAVMREEMGNGREQLLRQFNALPTAADALIAATHTQAL